jgi:glyoxylase-like metal-dependent hydrolase (beta-lactamase superfamily II)
MHNKQKLNTNMTIQALVNPVTPFAQNAPIIFCSETNKCAFVDPGGDADFLLQIAKENNLIPEKILLTHGHADHAGAAMEIAQILNIKIEGPHKEDKFLLDSLQSQGEMFGMQARNCVPDKWLEDGDSVTVGNSVLDVIFTPGHTPGHVIFFSNDSNLALVGDVIFRGSIGRTDLPRGNHQDLIDSIS